MAERSIVVRLRAEVSDFNRQIGSAGRSLSEFEKSQQKLGGAATTTMGRLVQSAQINEREWTLVGRSLLGVGAAITGVGAAMAVTGISYNTLQQQSRAALTTLLGSTEAVNAQMAEFDEFARNSPFAREVWLKAQQQMLGFGIEAQKVVPYLDAIENAVAATGGSNEDIAHLTRIFSQIQSAAKITAVDLMQFGQRGVDAATLIGTQMNMTGAEVREAISSGALDAQTALDALAAGMQDRYGGAADNVKNTMVGALDRVKAAFRDLSSELVSGLVNPEGGGGLVSFLNGLADAMRAFQDAPGWVKGAATALAGLTAAATLGGGAFMVALPRYVEFRGALQTLGAAHPGLARVTTSLGRFTASAAKVGALGAGFAALAVGAAKLYDQFSDARLPAGIERTTAALLGLDGLDINSMFDFGSAGSGFDDIASAAERLLSSNIGDRVNRWAGGIGRSLGIENNTWGNAAAQFEQVGEALAGLVNQGNGEAAAAIFEGLYAQVDQSKISSEEFMSLMPAYGAALDGLAVDAELAGDGMGDLAGGTSEAQAALEEWQKTVSGAGQSFGGIVDAYQSVIDKNRELAESTAAATGDAEASWEDFYDGTSVDIADWIAAMQEQQAATENWASNYQTALQQIADEVPATGRQAHLDFVAEMIAAGDEGAAALQEFVNATPAQRQELVDAWAGTNDAIEDVMGDPPVVEPIIRTKLAETQLVAWLAGMSAMGVDVPMSANTSIATTQMIAWRIGQELMNIEVDVDADTSDADAEIAETTDVDPVVIDLQSDAALANEELNGFYDDAAALDPTMYLDADTDPADGSLSKWVGSVDKTTAVADLDADDADAQGVLTGFGGSAARARPIVPLGADDKSARTTTSIFTGWAGDQNPKVKVGANDSSGRTATGYFTTWVGQQNPKAKVGANDTSARATTNDFTRWAERRKPSMGLRATSKAAKATVSNFSRWAARKTPAVSLRASTAGATKTVNNWLARQGKKSATVSIFAKTKGGFAGGGPVHGPGSGTSDSINARLSNGEHVWTAREVAAAGGHGAIMAMRQAVLSGAVRGFANGGAVSPTYVTTPSPVVHVAAPSPVERQRPLLHVDQIVAADPNAAAQAFTREVRYQTMGA